MKEKYSNKATVQLSPAVVALVINFIYTSYIKISMDTVYEVLEASDFLQIPYLKDCCGKVFKTHLNGSNCLKIRSYAKLYRMEDVAKIVESFINNNLSSVLQSKEFCNLPVDDVRIILHKQNEQESIDECKYHSLIRWTKHDIRRRCNEFKNLFTLIDLYNLSKKFVKTVVLIEKLVRDSKECTSQLLTALAERVPEGSQAKQVKDILVVGGINCPQSVVKYNLNLQQFSEMPSLNIARKFATTIRYRGCVFIMGGLDENEYTTYNSVETLTLNESNLKWKINPTTMIERRSCFASALLNDMIYCTGGFGRGRNSLSSVEVYDLKLGKWFRKDKMNEARSYHALVSTQGRLFAIGGYVDSGRTNTVEMFDPIHQNWKYISPMKFCRSNLCAVVLNDEIYAIGGSYYGSVEKYNLASQQWIDVASISNVREASSACVANGRIYVFGGYGPTYLEIYDSLNNKWEIGTEMDQERWYLSVEPI